MKNILLASFFLAFAANASATTDTLAHYLFNNNANDATANGFNGSLSGGPSAVTDRNGNSNGAFYFDGSSQYGLFGDILDTVFNRSTAKFSVSGWFKPNKYSSAGTTQFIIAKAAGGSGPYQWYITIWDDSTVWAVVHTSATTSPLSSAQWYGVKSKSKIKLNQWQHFAMVFDGSESTNKRVNLYFNGTGSNVLASKYGTLGTTTANTAQHITLAAGHVAGNSSTGNNFFKGEIDEITIMNGTLDSAEIYKYNNNIVAAARDTLACYLFNSNVNDTSTSGFHGTAKSSPSYGLGHDSISNSALCFNGTNQYVLLGDILDSVFTKAKPRYTITGWFKPASIPTSGNASFIVAKAAGGSGPYEWYVMLWDDGTLRGTVHSKASTSSMATAEWLCVKSQKSVTTNKWHSFAFVVDGTESDSDMVKIYLDGKKGVYATSNGSWTATTENTSQEITIAAGHAPTAPNTPNNLFAGCIDDITFLSYAMDKAEVDSVFPQKTYTGGGATSDTLVYIPFGGNADDSSVYSFSTSTAGNPSYSAGHDKVSNSALCFNGSTQYVRLGDILDTVFCRTLAKFSVGGWFNASSLPATGYASFIVAKASGGSGPYQWYLMLWDDGTLRATLHSTTSSAEYLCLKSTKKVVPGKWNAFAFVFDGSQAAANRVKLYMNGEEGVYASSNGTLGATSVNTSQEITIAAGHAPNQPSTPNNQFSGCIDNILILNKALTKQEAITMYPADTTQITTSRSSDTLAFYPLQGTVGDSGVYGFHGSVAGSPSYSAGHQSVANSALCFNGSNQYVRMGDILDTVFCRSVAKFSVTGWFNAASFPATGNASFIVAKAAGGSGPYQWYVMLWDDGTLRATLHSTANSAEYLCMKSTKKVATGKWNNFAFVFDGSQSVAKRVKLYMNGEEGTYASSAGTIGTTSVNTNQELTIAAGHAPNQPSTPKNQFTGCIDDILILNKSLSKQEVITIFPPDTTKPSVPLSSDTLAYYPMQGSVGDSGIYGFHGTVAGSPAYSNGHDSISNSALCFNGSTQYVRMGDILDSVFCRTVAKFTVTGWFNTASMPKAGEASFIVAKSAGGSGPYQWYVMLWDDGTLRATLHSTTSSSEYLCMKSIKKVVKGKWNNFAFVFDGSQASDDRVKLYMNGVEGVFADGAGTLGTTSVNTAQELTIAAGHAPGSPSTPNNQFSGCIDDIVILNKSLSKQDVVDIFPPDTTKIPPYSGRSSDTLAFYPLNGTVGDSGVYGFHGTANGNPNYTSGHNGGSNTALCFNGTSQYVLLGDILDSVFCRTIAKFSVTGWFKASSIPASGKSAFIVAKSAGGSGPYQLYVMLSDDGTLRGTLHSTPSTSNLGTAGWLSMKSNKSVVPGNWYKFTFVVDGSLSDSNRVKLFLDGEKGSFASSNGTWGTTSVNTDQELTIGAGHAPINPFAPNNQFDGCIDDILILNRAMADSELVLPNSIGHNISMSKVDVYPNPTDDNIFIQFNKTKVSKITLFDNAGKAVYLNNNISKADQLTINIEHLAKGIYHLNLLSDESSTTKKIVVY